MKSSLAKLLTLALLGLGIFGLVSFGCQRQGTEKKLSPTDATLPDFISEDSTLENPSPEDSPSEQPTSQKPSSERATSNLSTKAKLPSGKTALSKPTAAKPFPAWTQQANPARSDQQILITTKVMEITREAGLADIPAKKYKGICNHQQLQEFLRKKSQHKGTDTLTTPTVILRDGETATIEIIKEFVYPAGPEDDAAVETENTGVTSHYQALHLGGEDISLKSFSRICEFEGFSEVTPDFSLPVFTRRDIETSDRLKSGETIVIGGILDETTQKIEDSIFFGLIKSSSTQTFSRELIILITVELIEPDEEEPVSQ